MCRFSMLPIECQEIIFDFSAINWKKRFTLNVLPFLKSTHTVGDINGTPCFTCYINKVTKNRDDCSTCAWLEVSSTQDASFKDIMSTTGSVVLRTAKKRNVVSYERFALWLPRWTEHQDLEREIMLVHYQRTFQQETAQIPDVFNSTDF